MDMVCFVVACILLLSLLLLLLLFTCTCEMHVSTYVIYKHLLLVKD